MIYIKNRIKAYILVLMVFTVSSCKTSLVSMQNIRPVYVHWDVKNPSVCYDQLIRQTCCLLSVYNRKHTAEYTFVADKNNDTIKVFAPREETVDLEEHCDYCLRLHPIWLHRNMMSNTGYFITHGDTITVDFYTDSIYTNPKVFYLSGYSNKIDCDDSLPTYSFDDINNDFDKYKQYGLLNDSLYRSFVIECVRTFALSVNQYMDLPKANRIYYDSSNTTSLDSNQIGVPVIQYSDIKSKHLPNNVTIVSSPYMTACEGILEVNLLFDTFKNIKTYKNGILTHCYSSYFIYDKRNDRWILSLSKFTKAILHINYPVKKKK